MKKLILFYGAIMAGVILALIWKWNAPELFSRLVISRSDLLLLQNVTINFWNSFLPIVIKRGKFFLLLLLLELTPMRKILFNLLLIAIGFAIGIYGTGCVWSLGAIGFGVFVCSVLPQWPLYLLGCYLFCSEIEERWKRNAGCCLLFLAGTLIEASAGQWLIQKLLMLVS